MGSGVVGCGPGARGGSREVGVPAGALALPPRQRVPAQREAVAEAAEALAEAQAA